MPWHTCQPLATATPHPLIARFFRAAGRYQPATRPVAAGAARAAARLVRLATALGTTLLTALGSKTSDPQAHPQPAVLSGQVMPAASATTVAATSASGPAYTATATVFLDGLRPTVGSRSLTTNASNARYLAPNYDSNQEAGLLVIFAQ